MEKNNWKALFAEAIGTFVLVFFAVGVAALGGGLFPTALTFGLVIVIMSFLIGKVSGCHINPAVSLACLMTKRMSVRDFAGYVIAQVVGGLLGAICLFGIFKMADADEIQFFLGCNHAMDWEFEAGPIFAAMFVEIILTFVFVYVILHATDEKNGVAKYAGIIIGTALMFVHLFGINLTGTSVNPARSIAAAFGSLIFTGEAEALKHVWIFILAPMGGAALAAVVYNAINNKKADPKEEKVEEINSDDAAEEPKAE